MSKSMRWWLVASLAVVALLMLAACGAPVVEEGAAPAEEAEAETVIIYGLYQEPEILNRYIRTQTVATEAARHWDEGLVHTNPDGEFYAVLATEVPSLDNGGVSEDGLTITYSLRDDILWSDGEPFTCADVEFTFDAISHPESGAVYAGNYKQVESVTCVDDFTAVVQYSEFFAPFLSNFDSILPKHATGAPEEMTQWAYNRSPIGTGPFVLETWVQGDRMVLVPNENYRDFPEKPLADSIVLRFVESREVGKALITSGEIHGLWDMSEADIPDFQDNPDITIHAQPSSGTERFVFNLADPALDATDDPLNNPHPILGDLRVRQAIQFGIDKQFIIDELLYGMTTIGVSELSLGWAKCDIEPASYDPEQSIALLEEAGWVEGSDGVRVCDGCMYAEEGTPLSLSYQTTTGNQLREESQQLIIAMMNDIGVELNIENVPSSELFGSWDSGAFRKHGQYDILMYTTSDGIDPHSQMYGYFHSLSMPTEANVGTGFNYSRWVNEASDAAIVAASQTPDLVERKAQYQISCEQIDAELPHLYLYDRADIDLTRSNFVNYKINGWFNARSWNSADWDLE